MEVLCYARITIEFLVKSPDETGQGYTITL
jgi:hypothetical protein